MPIIDDEIYFTSEICPRCKSIWIREDFACRSNKMILEKIGIKL